MTATVTTTSQHQAQIKIKADRYTYTTNSNKPDRVIGANVEASVKRADLDPSDRVQLVWTHESQFVGNSNSGYMRPPPTSFTKKVDLNYVGNGEFAAPVGAFDLKTDGYGGSTETRGRFAVVINGEWQKDPRTNGDFNVDLYNTADEPSTTLPAGFAIGRYDGRTYLVFRNDGTSVPQNKILVHYKVGNEWKTARGEVVEGGGRGGPASMKVFLGDNDIPPGTQLEMAIAFQKPDGSTEWLNKGFGKNFFAST